MLFRSDSFLTFNLKNTVLKLIKNAEELQRAFLPQISDVFDLHTKLVFQQNRRLFKTVSYHHQPKTMFRQLNRLFDVAFIVALVLETKIEGHVVFSSEMPRRCLVVIFSRIVEELVNLRVVSEPLRIWIVAEKAKTRFEVIDGITKRCD